MSIKTFTMKLCQQVPEDFGNQQKQLMMETIVLETNYDI